MLGREQDQAQRRDSLPMLGARRAFFERVGGFCRLAWSISPAAAMAGCAVPSRQQELAFACQAHGWPRFLPAPAVHPKSGAPSTRMPRPCARCYGVGDNSRPVARGVSMAGQSICRSNAITVPPFKGVNLSQCWPTGQFHSHIMVC